VVLPADFIAALAIDHRDRDFRLRGACVRDRLPASLPHSTARRQAPPISTLPRALSAFARFAAIVAVLIAGERLLSANPTPQQKAKATTADSLVKKAGRQFTQKKYDEAAKTLTEAQKLLGELEADEEAKPLTTNLRKGITKAHGLLSAQGITLPPLEPAPAAGGGGGGGSGGGGKISFTKQVTPLLVGKCGRCHIDKSSGEFSMSSYAQLMKGSKDGIVLFPGKGKTSRMIELIEQQDMPRGGGTVSPDELAMLTKWIDEGAKFDGKDPTARLGGGTAGGAPPPDQPKVAVVQATGKEDVLFSRDIAPVLLANCTGCHGDQNPRGRLDVNNFARMLQGGESGAPLTPGNPAGSLIIRKLRGTAGGDRMPMGKPPLADDVIAKFEKWIAEGAKFDGTEAKQPITEVVAIYHAKTASHEELAEDRSKLAIKNWRTVMPDMPSERAETEHFLIYGTLGIKELEEVGKLAEEQVPKIEKSLKLTSPPPFIKGKLTLYVFQKQYDYSEVGNVLEGGRDTPAGTRGHWRYSVVDAYAGVVPPKSDEYSLAALLSEQIGAVYVAAQGQGAIPKWFSQGAGRAIASRLYPKDPLVRGWDSRIMSSMGECKNADDFQTGAINPEDADVLSYSFVKMLMANTPKFNTLLSAVHSGMPFEQAFAKAYNGTPSQIAMGWAHGGGSKKGR
jgi:hypothetical protein